MIIGPSEHSVGSRTVSAAGLLATIPANGFASPNSSEL